MEKGINNQNNIISVRGITPKIKGNCFIAPNSTIVGDVTMGENCSVWFGAVVRGDVNYIKIGDKTNIQDLAVIHGTYEKAPTNIGNNVSIGHRAIVHGCTIGDNVLIGMGAIVMDNCIVEKNSVIGAGAVVTQGTHVPEGTIFIGNPAKFYRYADEQVQEETIKRIANNYIMYSQWYEENDK